MLKSRRRTLRFISQTYRGYTLSKTYFPKSHSAPSTLSNHIPQNDHAAENPIRLEQPLDASQAIPLEVQWSKIDKRHFSWGESATRALSLEGLDASAAWTKERLVQKLGKLSLVEDVEIGRRMQTTGEFVGTYKWVVTVRFLSIYAASKAMHVMQSQEKWKKKFKSVSYAPDTSAHKTETVEEPVTESDGNRTVCLGNISPNVHCSKVISMVKTGQLERIGWLETATGSKAFLCFVSPASAVKFYEEATTTGLPAIRTHGGPLKVAWSSSETKNSAEIESQRSKVMTALIKDKGATRSLYVEVLYPAVARLTWTQVLNDFKEFGSIDKVAISSTPDGPNWARVDFTSIWHALSAKAKLAKAKPEVYGGAFIAFGWDSCAA